METLLKEYTHREKEALQVSRFEYVTFHFLDVLFVTSVCYELQVLSLEAEASIEEITRGYRELAKTWHPDHNPSKDAEQMFLKIQEAYDVLLRWHKPQRFK